MLGIRNRVNEDAYVVFRHKQRYCYRIERCRDGSDPSALGVAIADLVPRKPKKFQKWLELMRQWCEETYKQSRIACNDPKAVWRASRHQPQEDVHISWTYELDLDNLFFRIKSAPMFRLDNMPQGGAFVGYISLDHYGALAPALDTPWRCSAFSLTPPPPSVPREIQTTFYEFCQDKNSIPLHILLLRDSQPSRREVVCIKMLEVCVGLLMHHPRFHPVLRDIPLVPIVHRLPTLARNTMYALVQLAIFPLYYREALQRNVTPLSKEPFWWVRKHICVRPSTHLTDERNRQLAISELVSEIHRVGVDGMVYGIAFSLAHLVVIRVDKKSEGELTFRFSDVLDFLPSRFATTASTAGITALVRLGDLRADDDATFFLGLGHPSLFGSLPSENLGCRTLRRKPTRKRLPLELLILVANHIEDLTTLNRFAWASEHTMCASLHRLKYPQVVVRWPVGSGWYGKDGWRAESLLLHSGTDVERLTHGDWVDYSFLRRGTFKAFLGGEERCADFPGHLDPFIGGFTGEDRSTQYIELSKDLELS